MKQKFITILTASLLLAACSILPETDKANEKPSFTGTWLYSNQTEGTVASKKLTLKQSENVVTGTWLEGISTGSGGSGKVQGYIKENKLFLSYCSDEGNWYQPCPKYENNKGYFVIENNKMIEYYQIGEKYRKGDEFILNNTEF